MTQIQWQENPRRLVVEGDWTIGNGEILVKDIRGRMETETLDRLLLDLSRLRFIDSRGISNLLELRKVLAEKKIELVIVNPSPVSLKVFQLISLDRLIPFEEISPPQ